MDPELQKKIDAARAEGYTDEEINAYLGLRSAQTQAQQQGGPMPPEVAPQPEVNRRSEEQTAVGQGAAVLGAGAAVGGLGAGLGYKLAKPLVGAAMDAMRNTPAARPMTPPAAPVAPGNVIQGPWTQAPAATQQPSIIQRGMDIAGRMREMAAQRVLPAAGQMARGGGIAAAAMYSPELGPKVPSTGRMRGMEINPLTRRPWTPDQLAAYERNPAQFDSQLGAAQMPR